MEARAQTRDSKHIFYDTRGPCKPVHIDTYIGVCLYWSGGPKPPHSIPIQRNRWELQLAGFSKAGMINGIVYHAKWSSEAQKGVKHCLEQMIRVGHQGSSDSSCRKRGKRSGVSGWKYKLV